MRVMIQHMAASLGPLWDLKVPCLICPASNIRTPLPTSPAHLYLLFFILNYQILLVTIL